MCNFEVEIERHKEMLRNNEAKIHQLQVSNTNMASIPKVFLEGVVQLCLGFDAFSISNCFAIDACVIADFPLLAVC